MTQQCTYCHNAVDDSTSKEVVNQDESGKFIYKRACNQCYAERFEAQ